MIPEICNIFARYRRDVESRTVPEKLDKLAHHLFVSQRCFICPRFLFLLYEMIEPLGDGEHSQTLTVDALQYFTEQLACSRFRQPVLSRLVRGLLQCMRHFQRLALAR